MLRSQTARLPCVRLYGPCTVGGRAAVRRASESQQKLVCGTARHPWTGRNKKTTPVWASGVLTARRSTCLQLWPDLRNYTVYEISYTTVMRFRETAQSGGPTLRIRSATRVTRHTMRHTPSRIRPRHPHCLASAAACCFAWRARALLSFLRIDFESGSPGLCGVPIGVL